MKPFLLLITFFAITSFVPGQEGYLWFPEEVGTLQTCVGEVVELEVEIGTTSLFKVKVHSFALEQYGFELFVDGMPLAKTDTILLSKGKPVRLKVRYQLQASGRPACFSFRSNLNGYDSNRVRIGDGQYGVTFDDMEGNKEVFLTISKSCQDSVKLFFPYGGTYNHVSMENTGREIYKSVGYEMGEHRKYITFSKSDTGRYKVNYSACHADADFWLNLK